MKNKVKEGTIRTKIVSSSAKSCTVRIMVRSEDPIIWSIPGYQKPTKA